MDSLLANYASSDEEEHQQIIIPKIPSSSSTHPITKLPSSSSSGFSTLPTPKSQTPKRVVQFRPPINPYARSSAAVHPSDSDSDDNDPKPKKRPRAEPTFSSSAKSFLSSIPAPKNALGGGGGASLSSFSGRRSVVVQTQPPEPEPVAEPQPEFVPEPEPEFVPEGSKAESLYNPDSTSYGYEEMARWGGEIGAGKRGGRRREMIPEKMVEVKQDELMKNRPREDQSKLTGIAFGPSYQTASTKGKPTKLHKRKHQIGSLYFDMRQKEMELSERRARGMLTKSETHAKYGW